MSNKPYVYFIAGVTHKYTGYFKIGVSINWENRIKTLEGGCPFVLVPVYVMKTRKNTIIESAVMGVFAKYQSKGEWFYSKEPKKFIEKVTLYLDGCKTEMQGEVIYRINKEIKPHLVSSYCFEFGKYDGVPVNKIYKEDPSYIGYLIENEIGDFDLIMEHLGDRKTSKCYRAYHQQTRYRPVAFRHMAEIINGE